MRIQRLPAGFVIPAQPVLASKPPPVLIGSIKHDGYRMIVRRDATVRLVSRSGSSASANVL
jgi:ATP-dependent DNA ligase